MRFCFLFFVGIFPWLIWAAPLYVSYTPTGGRFGEQLQGYLHAKWIAYRYRTLLLYTPFSYSEHLRLDDLEESFAPPFSPHRFLAASNPLPDLSRYSCYCTDTSPVPEPVVVFDINWKDEAFRSLIRERVAPKHDLRLALPPKDRISIALHVREGGGYDSAETRQYAPLKIPPIGFYVIIPLQ